MQDRIDHAKVGREGRLMHAGMVIAMCGVLACGGTACCTQPRKGAMTTTHEFHVTMKGKPVVLSGRPIEEGTVAPVFMAVDAGFQPVRLSDFKGQVVLISAVLSLDTGGCSIQTRRFNQEAANLPSNVVVLTISEDLPFAQKRFCESEKIGRIRVLSDSVWREFGTKYGILIEGMGLLTRSVWVIGRDGKVVYRQIVQDTSHEPDYEAPLKAARLAAEAK